MLRITFKFYLLTNIIFLLASCEEQKTAEIIPQPNSINLIQHVNPFIGTKNMGHTFPGATVPFGAIQLSPETNHVPMYIDGDYNPQVYSYCAGYQYEDSTIFGFSHTHFSGTGHSDLGDLLIMPTTGTTESMILVMLLFLIVDIFLHSVMQMNLQSPLITVYIWITTM